MKLTAFLSLVFCLHVSAGALSQTVTLKGSNIEMEKVFKAVKRQTGYSVAYNKGLLRLTVPVTLDVRDQPLVAFLNLLSERHPLEFSIRNRTIFIKLKNLPAPVAPTPAPEAIAPHIISGQVLSADGIPLSGASVKIKGSASGTTTDSKGHFSLPAKEGDLLVISFVGYAEMTIRATNAPLVVKLSPTESKLDEVQIVAYGTTTRRLNTGNVSHIGSETIGEQPVSNPLAALEGRVPGLVITQQTGVPGGGFNVQIRGRNSIDNGGDPYYIVDGVPFTSTSLSSSLDIGAAGKISPFNSINPSDIESIDVLKDADATAIYGSNGANGVILITTKRGKAGRTDINLSAYSGAGKLTRMMKFLNTPQYIGMRREAFANDSATPVNPPDYDLLSWDTTRYTNWAKDLVGNTAKVTDAQLSVSGGNASTQFLIGGGFHRETTVFPGNYADQKASGHINLTHRSEDKKFKVLFSANYVSGTNTLPRVDVTAFTNLAPDAPAQLKADGTSIFTPGVGNPYALLQQRYKASPDNLTTNAVLSYQLLPGLQLRTSVGYNKLTQDEVMTAPFSTLNPDIGYTSGFSTFANGKTTSWIVEPQAEYQRTIGRGRLDVLAGTTFREDVSSGQTVYADGFATDALLQNLAASNDIFVFYTNYSDYKYNAVFGRIKYDYEDKYLLNLTARRDGSSRFGPGRQFANFGAVGAGWLFSKEKHVTDWLPALSYGKLRASYGVTGNDQIGDYRYLNLYTTTFYPYQGIIGYYPTSLYNPNFGWETNKKLEAGLELGFIKDRILFTASWYRNRSSSLLINYSLAPTTGFSSVQINLPALVQNQGWELELNTTNIKGHAFSWTSAINFTVPRNKLLAFPGLAASSYGNTYAIGQPLSIVKAFHSTGVDPQTGMYTFTDVNKDNIISYPEDLLAVKKVAIDFYGGFNNTLRYKGWQLDIFFQFVEQTGRNYAYAGNRENNFDAPGTFGNQPVYVLNRWQKPGDHTSVQKFTQNTGSAAYAAFTNAQTYGDNTVTDASFIRLKNISLSYQVPESRIKKTGIRTGSIYVRAQNLLTATHYQGWDPETQNNNMPPIRMMIAGIQFTL